MLSGSDGELDTGCSDGSEGPSKAAGRVAPAYPREGRARARSRGELGAGPGRERRGSDPDARPRAGGASTSTSASASATHLGAAYAPKPRPRAGPPPGPPPGAPGSAEMVIPPHLRLRARVTGSSGSLGSNHSGDHLYGAGGGADAAVGGGGGPRGSHSSSSASARSLDGAAAAPRSVDNSNPAWNGLDPEVVAMLATAAARGSGVYREPKASENGAPPELNPDATMTRDAHTLASQLGRHRPQALGDTLLFRAAETQRFDDEQREKNEALHHAGLHNSSLENPYSGPGGASAAAAVAPMDVDDLDDEWAGAGTDLGGRGLEEEVVVAPSAPRSRKRSVDFQANAPPSVCSAENAAAQGWGALGNFRPPNVEAAPRVRRHAVSHTIGAEEGFQLLDGSWYSEVTHEAGNIFEPDCQQVINGASVLLEYLMHDKRLAPAGVFDFSPAPPPGEKSLPERPRPQQYEIWMFLSAIDNACTWTSECLVYGLALLIRLMTYHPVIVLHAHNWKRVLLVMMLVSQKLWDDCSLRNIDFHRVWNFANPFGVETPMSLRELNELELAFVKLLSWDMSISRLAYTTIFMELCGMMSRCSGEDPVKTRADNSAHQITREEGASVTVIRDTNPKLEQISRSFRHEAKQSRVCEIHQGPNTPAEVPALDATQAAAAAGGGGQPSVGALLASFKKMKLDPSSSRHTVLVLSKITDAVGTLTGGRRREFTALKKAARAPEDMSETSTQRTASIFSTSSNGNSVMGDSPYAALAAQRQLRESNAAF